MPNNGHVFISYARADEAVAGQLRNALESNGVRCWVDQTDVSAGANWGNEIAQAIGDAKALVLILSAEAAQSPWVERELMIAQQRALPILPYRITETELPARLQYVLAGLHFINGSLETISADAKHLAGMLMEVAPDVAASASSQSERIEREAKTKGYVFISYIHRDADFVEKLRSVLESRRYGYWDYVVGSRDYHGALYRELEERIDGAVAFITIVSDDWRKSDWVASEFIYAREAKIPIFVIHAKSLNRPLPILLNLQTRIDMSGNFEEGVSVLVEELAKKGL